MFPACGPGDRYRSSAGPIGLGAGPAGKESVEKVHGSSCSRTYPSREPKAT